MDHGFFGRLLASLHYWLLGFSDLAVAMNSEMEQHLNNYRCRRVVMIPTLSMKLISKMLKYAIKLLWKENCFCWIFDY